MRVSEQARDLRSGCDIVKNRGTELENSSRPQSL